ncbi:hypothetical protein ACTXT7_003184, partial [Hymenolepis weldensis]
VRVVPGSNPGQARLRVVGGRSLLPAFNIPRSEAAARLGKQHRSHWEQHYYGYTADFTLNLLGLGWFVLIGLLDLSVKDVCRLEHFSSDFSPTARTIVPFSRSCLISAPFAVMNNWSNLVDDLDLFYNLERFHERDA